jgi:hypothetical protein
VDATTSVPERESGNKEHQDETEKKYKSNKQKKKKTGKKQGKKETLCFESHVFLVFCFLNLFLKQSQPRYFLPTAAAKISLVAAMQRLIVCLFIHSWNRHTHTKSKNFVGHECHYSDGRNFPTIVFFLPSLSAPDKRKKERWMDT